ncbi:MAG TPA: alpha/beta fold hydrolase [Thermoanaerobaculia bacterium]|jgi:pimeloyl-ACP methyl ester carboxylesterase
MTIATLAACSSATRPTLQPCESPGVTGRVSCGTVRVPENPAQPRGRALDIAFKVLHATSSDPKPDPILFFAGGPGQAGTDIAPLVAQMLATTRAERDVVLVDQRGTGRSNPLPCKPLVDDLESLVGSFAAGALSEADLVRCRDELSQRADLRMYTTTIAMHDFDRVRAALGYERVNLVGGSYGSRAALVYARLFPERVRSVVLRGGGTTELKLPLNVARDVEAAFEALFRDCAADPSCVARYGDVRAKFRSIYARLENAPVVLEAIDPRNQQPSRLTVTQAVFVGGLLFTLYSSDSAAAVPLILDRAAAGEWKPFLSVVVPTTVALAGQVYLGMHFSVTCAEDVPQFTVDDVRRESEGTLLGPHSGLAAIDRCRIWPRGEVPPDFHDPFRVEAPVLILSGLVDPALPPRYGDIDAQSLPNSRHILLPATGHVPSYPGCTAEQVARFIDTASFDGLDWSCVEDLKRPEWR